MKKMKNPLKAIWCFFFGVNAHGLHVYKMNHYEWFCAHNKVEVLQEYEKYIVECHSKHTEDYREALEECEPEKLSTRELRHHTFHDGMIRRSFEAELELRTKPGFFATTEF